MLLLPRIAFAPFALLAAGSPLPSAKDIGLIRRSAEGLHLANCVYNGGQAQSYMIYYSNDGNSNGGNPNDQAFISNDNIIWEGQTLTGRFQGSGASATSRISGGNHATYSYSGSASNSYGQQFNCYRDNEHQMFSNYNGLACNSIYYCLDA